MKLNNTQNNMLMKCIVTNIRAGKPGNVVIQVVTDFLCNTYNVEYQEARQKSTKLYEGCQILLNRNREAS